MKVTFDPEADAMKITLRDGEYDESEELAPGFIFDFAKDGTVLGIEILGVSKAVDDPLTVSVRLLQRERAAGPVAAE